MLTGKPFFSMLSVPILNVADKRQSLLNKVAAGWLVVFTCSLAFLVTDYIGFRNNTIELQRQASVRLKAWDESVRISNERKRLWDEQWKIEHPDKPVPKPSSSLIMTTPTLAQVETVPLKELINFGALGIALMISVWFNIRQYKDGREDAKVIQKVVDFLERLDRRMP